MLHGCDKALIPSKCNTYQVFVGRVVVVIVVGIGVVVGMGQPLAGKEWTFIYLKSFGVPHLVFTPCNLP